MEDNRIWVNLDNQSKTELSEEWREKPEDPVKTSNKGVESSSSKNFTGLELAVTEETKGESIEFQSPITIEEMLLNHQLNTLWN